MYLNLHVLNKPELFSNAFTPCFDDKGNVVDEALTKQTAEVMQALAQWTRQLKK